LKAFKRTWAQKLLKNLTYPNQKWQASYKNLKKGGKSIVNRKVFEKNTKKGSQMLRGYPLTSGMHQHDEHLHPKPSIKNMKRRNHAFPYRSCHKLIFAFSYYCFKSTFAGLSKGSTY
jgi:hypothetical protein